MQVEADQVANGIIVLGAIEATDGDSPCAAVVRVSSTVSSQELMVSSSSSFGRGSPSGGMFSVRRLSATRSRSDRCFGSGTPSRKTSRTTPPWPWRYRGSASSIDRTAARRLCEKMGGVRGSVTSVGDSSGKAACSGATEATSLVARTRPSRPRRTSG